MGINNYIIGYQILAIEWALNGLGTMQPLVTVHLLLFSKPGFFGA